MADDDEEAAGMKTMLTKETLVPLGIVVSVVLAIAGGAVWLNDTLRGIDYRLQRLTEQMTAVKDQVRASEGITQREMKLWIELMRARNNTLSVPDFPQVIR